MSDLIRPLGEYLSLLEQEELTPQRRLALMRELKKLTGRMEWLVEALLKMAQLDAGTVVFHPQDTTAAELVRRAAAETGAKVWNIFRRKFGKKK